MILIDYYYKKDPSASNIINRLSTKLGSLSKSHRVYRKQIDKVLLLNFSEQIIISSEVEAYNKEINSKAIRKGKNADSNAVTIKIVPDVIVVNIFEISSSVKHNLHSNENYTGYEQNLIIDAIKNIIGEDKIIFLFERIDSMFTNILLSLDNMIGFYRRIEHGRLFYTEIKNPRRFLEIVIQLSTPSNQVFASDQKNFFPFYNNSKRYLNKNDRKIFLHGGDKYLSDLILADYQKSKKILMYDCTEGNFYIHNNKYGFIFDNFDSLSPDDRSRLINKLITNEYKNHTIILRSKSDIDDISLLNFKKVKVLSLEKILPQLPYIFLMTLKARGVKGVDDFRKYWLRYLKSSALVLLYKSLKSLYQLDLLIGNVLNESEIVIDPRKLEFWFDLIQHFENLGVQETTSSNIENRKENLGNYLQYPNQFLRRENNKIKIIFEGKDIALRNEDLLGLHYLRLIIKYGINGISHKELENYYYQNREESKEIKKINAENYYQGKEDEKRISLRTLEESITHKVVDKKTIRSIKREIDDLKEEAKILENELRIDEADELNQKIKKLSENMRKYKNKEGEIREFDEDFRKRKRRVKKAYNGAMEQIKEDNLEFYLYLAKTIDDKKDPNKYFFVPLNNVDWILD